MFVAERRDFGWWLGVFLAPVGLVGGPLAIADMLAGVIQWHGVIGYAVTFWQEHVSAPFGQILAALFAWIGLPRPSDELVDYLTLGILFFAGGIRARSLMLSREYVRARGYRGNPLVGVVLRIVQIVCVIGLWPLVAGILFLQMVSYAWQQWRGLPRLDFEGRERAWVSAVGLAPFGIFLLLWLINIAWGAWATSTA